MVAPVSYSHSKHSEPVRYGATYAPVRTSPSSTTDLAGPSAKLQLLQVTHEKDHVLVSPPQEISELSSEEGRG